MSDWRLGLRAVTFDFGNTLVPVGRDDLRRVVELTVVELAATSGPFDREAFLAAWAEERERQFAAFRATVELALEERVDLFLVAGDLFDSNTQPRRSVERAASELGRLAAAKIRTVLIPGTHDVYDRSSVYRAYDLPQLAGVRPDDDSVTVLGRDGGSAKIDATVLFEVDAGRVEEVYRTVGSNYLEKIVRPSAYPPPNLSDDLAAAAKRFPVSRFILY